MQKGEIIVGLDIGTTKVCAVIGEIVEGKEGEEVEILGLGTARSQGLRKGVVVNLELTIKAIEEAVAESERMAGVEATSVYTNIAGGHIKGLNSHGVIAIRGAGGTVTQADVKRAIDAAKAVAIPLDREVIHIIPQQFIIDGQDGIKDPIGMSGVRLEVETHIITGSSTSAQNIVKSINRAGFKVEDIVLEPLADSYAVLTPEEKELGTVLVNIGGGTTDIVIFIEGSIWHTEVLAIGGDNVTKDISIGLRTPIQEAERIKKAYGCCLASLVPDEEMIEVPSVGGRKARRLPRQVLAEIIEPRMEEIFNLINREIRMTGYENLIASGVVLTGGTSLLEGVVELGERVFGLPVKIGVVRGIGGLTDVVNSPLYATSVGLVLYGKEDRLEGEKSRFRGKDLFKGIPNRIKGWFKDFFS